MIFTSREWRRRGNARKAFILTVLFQSPSFHSSKEFSEHGLDSIVTCRQSDACEAGFVGVDEEADAVFLDLPRPWDAIVNAKKALRKDVDTRICSFSPCIEQVPLPAD